MKRKTAFQILGVLLFMNLFWAFGWAYLKDFTNYSSFAAVFAAKAWINAIGTCVFLMVGHDFGWFDDK
jgi:hypothetical protein